MARLQVQPSINDLRSQAMLALIERLGAIDLSALLVYRIDSVPASALPLLAWQFDVVSQFWQLLASPGGSVGSSSVDALTDVDTVADVDTLSYGADNPNAPGAQGSASPFDPAAAARALLKQAIALHRMRGTPAAIREALATLGFAEITLLEGQARWGGTSYPSSQGWAAYRIVIDLPAEALNPSADPEVVASPDSAAQALQAAAFFAPARCWLDSLWFAVPAIGDVALAPADNLTLTGIAEYQIDSVPPPADMVALLVTVEALSDSFAAAAPQYDSRYRHSGITYGAGEPLVADAALVLNGAPLLQGG